MLPKMSDNTIKKYLKEWERVKPTSILSRLNKGTIVQKSWGKSYEIDDPEIDKRLGEYDPGQIPLGKIYHSFDPDTGKIRNLFGDRDIIPFSEMINLGLGECLEKAILVQLAAQRGRNSFLINGIMGIEQNGIIPLEAHGYNIVFKDNQAYLVDAQNPAEVNGEKIIPYVVPITGINSDCEFELDKKLGGERIYGI